MATVSGRHGSEPGPGARRETPGSRNHPDKYDNNNNTTNNNNNDNSSHTYNNSNNSNTYNNNTNNDNNNSNNNNDDNDRGPWTARSAPKCGRDRDGVLEPKCCVARGR